MKVKLYVIPGSHPGIAARLMLERKGIPYRRIDLLPVLSRRLIKLFGFSGRPHARDEDRRSQGPGLARTLPASSTASSPTLRCFRPIQSSARRVEEAERWGSEQLQAAPRKIIWWALKRRTGRPGVFLKDARLGLRSHPRAGRDLGADHPDGEQINNSTDEVVRDTLASIPAAIDRVDALIAEGVLNGDELNAADYQIAHQPAAADVVRRRRADVRGPARG